VNDRGPFIKGRIIDLSVNAARALGMIGAGVGMVSLASD
jgi:rare lipoprotein A